MERDERSESLVLTGYDTCTCMYHTGDMYMHKHTHTYRFGHVFLWDSGSSVGQISGHSKFINAIDYRPVRPFRVVTAGEDNDICWFEGPPFRFKSSLKVCVYSTNIC